MNHYFDKIYCLNQDSRSDRWAQATAEFARVGIQVERFASIPADQPNKSFCLSQYGMLHRFLQSGAKTALLLEDDVIFKDLSPLNAAMKCLPDCWDVLYLGANITEGVFGIQEYPPMPTGYGPNLWRIKRAWTTHAIAYTRRIAEIIVKKYPVDTFDMYDNWLSHNILEHYHCYLVNPMVAHQRPGISDLWGGVQTDYTGAFLAGDKIMGKV